MAQNENANDYFKVVREMLENTAEEIKELKASQEKLSLSQTKTDEQMKRTDEKLERIGIRLGNISNNYGEYTEDFFWHAVKNITEFEGIKVHYTEANVKPSRKNGVEDEFDILLWNGDSVIIIEVKYKVHPNIVTQLKTKKIPNFRTLMPDRKDIKIYCAVAGFIISEEVADLIKEEGFFVLRQASDDSIIIEKDKIKAY